MSHLDIFWQMRCVFSFDFLSINRISRNILLLSGICDVCTVFHNNLPLHNAAASKNLCFFPETEIICLHCPFILLPFCSLICFVSLLLLLLLSLVWDTVCSRLGAGQQGWVLVLCCLWLPAKPADCHATLRGHRLTHCPLPTLHLATMFSAPWHGVPTSWQP